MAQSFLIYGRRPKCNCLCTRQGEKKANIFHPSFEGSLVIYVEERMTEHVDKDEQHDKKKLKSFLDIDSRLEQPMRGHAE